MYQSHEQLCLGVLKKYYVISSMSNRNFGYYGNNGMNRLQQQNYARNLYINNTNGKQIINNPQTSNGNASNFNTYHEGSQKTYSRGLLGTGETVSPGGIFGVPPVPPVPPVVPLVVICTSNTTIDINSIATFDNVETYNLNNNTIISEYCVLNIPYSMTLNIKAGLTLTNNGTINSDATLIINYGTIINNGIIVGTSAGCIDNHYTFTNNGIMYINTYTYLQNISGGTFTNNNIIYVYTTPPFNTSKIRNYDIFINNGIIYTGSEVCGIGLIVGSVPITGTGTITPGCPP